MYDIKLIASFFIYKANEEIIDEGLTEGISHLKLQKILYFAQAVFLSIKNSALFEDEILAWKYGPVIESIYEEYSRNRKKGNTPLTKDDILCDNFSDINQEDKKLLNEVWKEFGKYSANELVQITHTHKPWVGAYANNSILGFQGIIEKDIIKEYYRNLFSID